METFDFHGHRIAYVRTGAGPPVVLLHNGGMSHSIWRRQIEQLAASHEVFALDLPGYGASAEPSQGYRLADYVNCLSGFVDEHELGPVTLVGNCMGSAMSLAFTARRPRDVAALVLVNPLTEATFAAGRLGMLYRLNRRAPTLSHPVLRLVSRARLPRWAVTQTMWLQLGRCGRATGVQRDAELRACYARPQPLRSLTGALHELSGYGALDQLVPTTDFPPLCTIWGRQNLVLSAAVGHRLNARLRPRREEWLDECGHLPMVEQPEEVTRILQEFLAECPAQGVHEA